MKPLGKYYKVGNHNMHIYVSGASTDLPTIVIEAGNSMPSIYYYRLQQKLCSKVQVVSYDRAGLGWSEAHSGPKDALTITAELRQLLRLADVRCPLIMVGHSIGGILLMAFAKAYPQDIAGAVFLDAIHPERCRTPLWSKWVELACKTYNEQKKFAISNCIHSVDQQLINEFSDIPLIQQQLQHSAMQLSRYDTSIQTLMDFELSASQAENCHALKHLPVTSISADIVTTSGQLPDLDQDGGLPKQCLQKKLAALSLQGRHIVIKNADHSSLVSNPEYAAIVVREILNVASHYDA